MYSICWPTEVLVAHEKLWLGPQLTVHFAGVIAASSEQMCCGLSHDFRMGMQEGSVHPLAETQDQSDQRTTKLHNN